MKSLTCLLFLILGICGLSSTEPTTILPASSESYEVPSDSLAMIAAGAKLYNRTLPCGTCHGYHLERPDEGTPSLLTLHLRYGAQAKTVFRKALNEGRPDKGMPSWEFLTDRQKTRIETYVFSLQNQP